MCKEMRNNHAVQVYCTTCYNSYCIHLEQIYCWATRQFLRVHSTRVYKLPWQINLMSLTYMTSKIQFHNIITIKIRTDKNKQTVRKERRKCLIDVGKAWNPRTPELTLANLKWLIVRKIISW